MKLYSYSGPVLLFNKVATNHWYAETMAISERKAKANLLYQWKKKFGYNPKASVKLPGKICEVTQYD